MNPGKEQGGAAGGRGWVILGNSGSGKSTLARRITEERGAAALDLDTVAWRKDRAEPVRRTVAEVAPELEAFVAAHPDGWVLEGCYEDLIAYALKWRPELVWLDTPARVCVERIRGRAYEPHKYTSAEAQRAAAGELARWIEGYATREGPMSRAAHEAVFAGYDGAKRRAGRGEGPGA